MLGNILIYLESSDLGCDMSGSGEIGGGDRGVVGEWGGCWNWLIYKGIWWVEKRLLSI